MPAEGPEGTDTLADAALAQQIINNVVMMQRFDRRRNDRGKPSRWTSGFDCSVPTGVNFSIEPDDFTLSPFRKLVPEPHWPRDTVNYLKLPHLKDAPALQQAFGRRMWAGVTQEMVRAVVLTRMEALIATQRRAIELWQRHASDARAYVDPDIIANTVQTYFVLIERLTRLCEDVRTASARYGYDLTGAGLTIRPASSGSPPLIARFST